MQKNRVIACIAGCAIVLAGFAIAQEKEKEEQGGAMKPPMAKFGPVDAIKTALIKVPGTALQANFEFDEGHWVYGVMIVHDHKLSEVEIDPMTGKVGDVEDVTPAGEAKEVEAELNKAIK